MPYADPAPPRLGRGDLRFSNAAAWTNSLRVDPGLDWPGYALIVDGENLVERGSLSVGLGAGVFATAWVEGSALFPGLMDPVLSGFHHLFGFANQWRDSVPPNRLDIEVLIPGGSLPSIDDSRLGPQSAGLGLGWTPGLPLLPSLTLLAKLPVAAPEPWLLGRSPGFALSSSSSFSAGPIEAGLALGLAWQGRPEALAALPARSWLPQASARLFYRLGPDLSFGLLGAATASPHAVDEWYLGGLVGNLWTGLNLRLSPGCSLEAALIEELASWASVEVGFQAGLRWEAGAGAAER